MNGDFVITGYAKGQPISSAGSKVYIISVNGSGNLNWTKTIGSTFLEDGFSIQQTSDRGFIIGGYQEDWGPGWDGFYLIKTDSLGNSGCNELNSDTTVTSPATVASDVITLVTSGGNVGMPVWHINTGTMVANICSSVGIAENRISYFINIYPNPTTSTFTISLPNQSSLLNSQLKIYDVTGRVVHEQIITQKSEIINQHLAPGVYFVKVEEGEKNFTQKLIVE
jgi:hypothetical protein